MNILSIVFLLVIIFAIIYFIRYFRKRDKSESFQNGCVQEQNFDDPNFANKRFFHYDNIDNLIASDSVHVPREVVESALMSDSDISAYFGDVKKKTQ